MHTETIFDFFFFYIGYILLSNDYLVLIQTKNRNETKEKSVRSDEYKLFYFFACKKSLNVCLPILCMVR